MTELKNFIRDVPDFPKKGIIFKDITPLLMSPEALKKVIELFVERFKGQKIDKIAAVESRGFIFASAVSIALGVGFVPIRKNGKLPWAKVYEEYELEYGTDKIEMHADAINPGDNVLILDDVLATGGTVGAVNKLITRQKGHVVGHAFVIELGFLKGREKLKGQEIYSILRYE